MAALDHARRTGDALLASYAQILIARSRVSGFLLLMATALDLPTCAGGLAALAGTALVARALTLPPGVVAEGPYGYNALFAGLAIGHLFGAGPGTLALAAAWGGLTVLLTSAFVATAGRMLALPALTVPFLLAAYLLLLVAPGLGLAPRLESLPDVAHAPAVEWLTWIGALVFVPRVEAGLLVVAALLIHSRIAFLLGAAGAIALVPFLRQAGLPPAMAAPMLFNGVLAAMALGGTWFVPGPASFGLAAAGAALCGLATLALQRVLAFWGLPLFVLPFNVVLLVVLCAMRQRARDQFPKAVDFAPGSPERNLRFYQTRIQRALAASGAGIAFGLPFRGSWLCTQGIDGAHTHQGPWRHAFDFEVAGQDGRLLLSGELPNDLASYHCYRLPVLAAADGTVVKVENDVPDNPVGGMDLDRNWGNVVMLWHAPGVYSLVAHLAPQSVTVREGQVVKRGEVVGLCGN
ncbi:MAG TPA: urea transporter, partial [Streptosporangiaceae bacterium]|nr:urea transporter [Streptosporangiaceae bacterium]